jgi:hypothetical protein
MDRGEGSGWGNSGRRAPRGRAETREARAPARSRRLSRNQTQGGAAGHAVSQAAGNKSDANYRRNNPDRGYMLLQAAPPVLARRIQIIYCCA